MSGMAWHGMAWEVTLDAVLFTGLVCRNMLSYLRVYVLSRVALHEPQPP